MELKTCSSQLCIRLRVAAVRDNVMGNRLPGFLSSRFAGGARLRADPICMLSKNFLAIHQLDIDWWTEFLYVVYRENCPSRIVSSKRADTVGQPPSKF